MIVMDNLTPLECILQVLKTGLLPQSFSQILMKLTHHLTMKIWV